MHVCLGKKSIPFWMKEKGDLYDVQTLIFNKLSTCGTTSVEKINLCIKFFVGAHSSFSFCMTYSVLLDFVGTKKKYKDNYSS